MQTKTSEVDAAFRDRVVAAADEALDAVLAAPVGGLHEAPLGPHRESMRRTKLLVAGYLGGGRHAGRPELVARALEYVDALAGLQTPSGLFSGGDNVESSPDSAFTVNDACDALELAARSGDAALEPVLARLGPVVDATVPALLTGGVHTPNHRWELAAALARLHRTRGAAGARERALEWLAEAIDQQRDGLYSERSANYAAHVSNPSLTVIGEVFERPEARAAVVRNLHATLGLILPDGTVETVHSRRQDQKGPGFPLADYLIAFRRFAIADGDGRLAWAAQYAAEQGITEPQTALAEILLDPRLVAPLPAVIAPECAGRTVWSGSGLTVDRNARRTLVVYGGSDYPAHRRIRSGLANNPTLLRMFAGETVLDSVRLSRDFFGLGPFRGTLEDPSARGRLVLTERLEGRYYQPLEPERRREDGGYDVVDEGRFAAAMSFDRRATTPVELATRITVRPVADGAEIEIESEGPELTWALELAFRPGGEFEGVSTGPGGVGVLEGGVGRYRRGRTAIEFGPGAGQGLGAAKYRPGEEYEYLGGTDALGGPRVYLTGRTPGLTRFTLRARTI